MELRDKGRLHEDPILARMCEACGFHDYSTFYRLFRRLTGMGPTAIGKG